MLYPLLALLTLHFQVLCWSCPCCSLIILPTILTTLFSDATDKTELTCRPLILINTLSQSPDPFILLQRGWDKIFALSILQLFSHSPFSCSPSPCLPPPCSPSCHDPQWLTLGNSFHISPFSLNHVAHATPSSYLFYIRSCTISWCILVSPS